jgi:hypothetical protein
LNEMRNVVRARMRHIQAKAHVAASLAQVRNV